MKVFAAVLVACLVMSVYSQSSGLAGAGTGGVTGGNLAGLAGLAGAQRGGLLGGNAMGLALMTGQLGDGMQRLMQCQIMGLPAILCMSM